MSEAALSPVICSGSSSQPANKDHPQVSVAVAIGSRLPGGMCSFVFLCNYLSSVTLKCVPVCLCLSTIKSNSSVPDSRIIDHSATRSSNQSLILLFFIKTMLKGFWIYDNNNLRCAVCCVDELLLM